MSRKIEVIDNEIAALHDRIKELEAEKKKLKGNHPVTCFCCKKKSRISKIPLLVSLTYDDEIYNERWVRGGHNYMVCPKCKGTSWVRDIKYQIHKKGTYIDQEKYLHHFGIEIEFYDRDYRQAHDGIESAEKKALEWIEKNGRLKKST